MTDRFHSPAETARLLGVSAKALRLYETRGLVKPLRTASGWRAYGPDQLARLHQVLALKRMGLALKRIGELLEGRQVDLDAILALQEAELRRRRREADRGLALLAAARARLKAGQKLSTDDLTQLTRETVMTKQTLTGEQMQAVFEPLGAKHFTDEEKAALARRAEIEGEAGDQDWAAMIAEATVVMANHGPTDPEAMDMARRWMALVGRFTGGDPDMNRKVRDMWQDAYQDPDFRERSPVSPQMMAYVGEAYRFAVATGAAT